MITFDDLDIKGMDPSANLEDQLRLALVIQHQLDNKEEPSKKAINRLTLLVIALDQWIDENGMRDVYNKEK